MVKLLSCPSLSWATLVRTLLMYYSVGIFSDTNLLTPAADWCALKLDSKTGTESLPEEEKINPTVISEEIHVQYNSARGDNTPVPNLPLTSGALDLLCFASFKGGLI